MSDKPTDLCSLCGGSGHKANRCPWLAYRESAGE